MKVLKNYKSTIILLLAMLTGGVVGAIMGPKAVMFEPIANLFLNLLFCCVVPLIFSSLVAAITKMENTKKLGKILGTMMVLFIVASVIAAIYMLVVCIVFDPAKGVVNNFTETIDAGSTNFDFLSMLTVSDFPLLLSRQNLLALVIASLAVGVACTQIREKAQPLIDTIEALSDVIIKIVGYVMKLAPLGLGCFFAVLIGEHGSELAGPLSRAIIVYMVAILIYFILSNTVFAYIGAGKKGVKAFWKHAIPPSLTALGTCSSAATIPVNLEAGRNIGLSSEINDIVIPMGASLHKDGAVLIQILKIAFMCSLFDVNLLSPSNLITAITVSVVASTVMGAIPGGGYTGEIFIVSAFGFPEVAIPIMVLIGTITDAPATSLNCAGDLGIAMILERIINGKNWLKEKVKQ